MDGATITIEGPFAFSIKMPGETDARFLRLHSGEWRIDGRWIAQGRIDRFDALARALREIEENTR
jgi:hypothetical protein